MADTDGQGESAAPGTVGARLRAAREAAGLSRADIAARTKIAERHLAAIEDDRFSDLASRTYAVGFSRSYARAVGLNEAEIADAVRVALASGEDTWERSAVSVFEPGDPARVPPSRVAWIAGLAALAVVAIVFAAWRSYYDPAISLPDLTSDEPAAAASGEIAANAAVTAPTGGEVVFTALEPGVWVKFYDAAGAQLMQKQMAQGETFAVPATAQGPMLWTARPDALAITIGGKPVPPLSDRQTTMKDVPVSAAALLARTTAPATGAAPTQGAARSPARTAAPSPRAPAEAAVRRPDSASATRAGAPAANPPVAAPAAAVLPAAAAPQAPAGEQPSTVSD